MRNINYHGSQFQHILCTVTLVVHRTVSITSKSTLLFVSPAMAISSDTVGGSEVEMFGAGRLPNSRVMEIRLKPDADKRLRRTLKGVSSETILSITAHILILLVVRCMVTVDSLNNSDLVRVNLQYKGQILNEVTNVEKVIYTDG